jgi:hypothetical protein
MRYISRKKDLMIQIFGSFDQRCLVGRHLPAVKIVINRAEAAGIAIAFFLLTMARL